MVLISGYSAKGVVVVVVVVAFAVIFRQSSVNLSDKCSEHKIVEHHTQNTVGALQKPLLDLSSRFWGGFLT